MAGVAEECVDRVDRLAELVRGSQRSRLASSGLCFQYPDNFMYATFIDLHLGHFRGLNVVKYTVNLGY